MGTSGLSSVLIKQSTKIIEGFIKKGIFRGSIFLGTLALLMGCHDLLTGKAVEYQLEGAKKKTSQELLIANVTQIASINQNGPEIMVTLPYESRGGAVPIECKLESESLVRLEIITPCACNGGVCRVGIGPQADVHGDGSFAFHLVDTEKVASRTGNVKVKILPVTISVVSGDRQAGTVGTKLSDPLVALVHNSENVPVSGVKVSWKVLDDEGGSICPETTSTTSDNEGKSKCNWILGTKVGVDKISVDRQVKVSIFDGGRDKGAQPTAQFSATVKSGPAVGLIFHQYPKPKVVAGMMDAIGIYPQDKYGNLAEVQSNKDLKVTLSLEKKPEGGTLMGKSSQTILSSWEGGTFSGLYLEKAGLYSLKANISGSDSGLEVLGKVFEVIPAEAEKLVFDQQPNESAVAGVPWEPQLQVAVWDSFDNVVTDFSAEVTLAIDANPGGGTLSGKAENGAGNPAIVKEKITVKAEGGIAKFTGLSIDKAGNGYTLVASSDKLKATSSAFDVLVPGGKPAPPLVPAKLVFLKQPQAGIEGVPGKAGDPFDQQPTVVIQDASGKTVTTSSAKVTLAIGTNPGGGTLSGKVRDGADNPAIVKGEITVAAVKGVAIFSDLSIDKVGKYTLKASSPDLKEEVSEKFDITHGPAAKLVFTTQPNKARVGKKFEQQPIVTIQDAFGNTVTGGLDSGAILTMSLVPGTEPLSGPSIIAVLGVALWTDLAVHSAGEKTLQVTKPDLRTVGTGVLTENSSPFSVSTGAAAKLAFSVQPGGGQAGTAWVQQPQVTILDASGKTVADSSAEVTLAIDANPGGGTLNSTSVKEKITVKAEGGIAKFTGLSIDKVGKYILKASSPDLKEEVSNKFGIIHGPAAKLVFTTQPSEKATAGKPFDRQPHVTIQDAFGNTVTSGLDSAGAILTMSLVSGTGTLSGEVKAMAVLGVALWTDLAVHSAGEKTLQVTKPDLTKAGGTGDLTENSSSFSVSPGAAAQLAFSVPPGGGKAGIPWDPQPQVTILDDYGNKVTDSSAEVTLTIVANPGGGTLSGTVKDNAGNPIIVKEKITVKAEGGIAKFTGLSIDKAGKYSLKASTSGLKEGKVSEKFDITHGSAAKLAFFKQPQAGINIVLPGKAGEPFFQQPEVAVQDNFGNVVADSSAEVTLAIETVKDNAGSLLPKEKITVKAEGGIAKFTGLSVDKVGKYILKASSPDLKEEVSNEFAITHGPAAKLVFTIPPSKDATAGIPFPQQPEVVIQDAFGNTVDNGPDSGATLTMSLVSDTGVLPGASALAVLGEAKWIGLAVKSAGEKKLRVTKPDLTKDGGTGDLTGESSSFIVSPGAAARLAFIQEPSGAVAGEVFKQQPVVEIQDKEGNRVISGPDSEVTITIRIYEEEPTGGDILSGTLDLQTKGGRASWSGLAIDVPGSKKLIAKKPKTIASKKNGASKEFSIISAPFDNEQNPPTAPNVTVRAGDKTVTLNWPVSARATSYAIYREEKPKGVFDKSSFVLNSLTNTYTDSDVINGKTYYYKIGAMSRNGSNDVSKLSEIPAQPLSTPSIPSFKVNDKIGAGALEVSWSPSAGASSYTVRYSTTKDGAAQGTEGCTAKAPETNCVVKNLKEGVTYYAMVRATNEQSGQVDSPEADEIPRRAPGLSVDSHVEGIRFSFSRLQGATSYELLYGEKSGEYTKKNEVKDYHDRYSIEGFVSGLTAWKTYYFKVVAIFYNGSLSSEEKSSIVGGNPEPFNIISATPLPEGGGVELVWEASSRAVSYDVFPGDAVEGPHLPLNGYNKITSTSFKIVDLDPGNYSFKVKAFSEVQPGSHWPVYGSRYSNNVMSALVAYPRNYILVPALAGYTTKDFYVAKYEMKLTYDGRSGYDIGISSAEDEPWSGAYDDEYEKKYVMYRCLNPLSLISNAQWQTIARNIESVASNWSGGSVGSGFLNRGHSDNKPNASLVASPDDNNSCEGTENSCNKTVWHDQRRTHVLTNGKIIWDFGGNVGEVVRDDYADLGVSPVTPGTWVESKDLLEANRKLFGSSNAAWGRAQGLGDYLPGKGSKESILFRGGTWHDGEHSGVFSAKFLEPDEINDRYKRAKEGIGFRCVYEPEP